MIKKNKRPLVTKKTNNRACSRIDRASLFVTCTLFAIVTVLLFNRSFSRKASPSVLGDDNEDRHDGRIILLAPTPTLTSTYLPTSTSTSLSTPTPTSTPTLIPTSTPTPTSTLLTPVSTPTVTIATVFVPLVTITPSIHPVNLEVIPTSNTRETVIDTKVDSVVPTHSFTPPPSISIAPETVNVTPTILPKISSKSITTTILDTVKTQFKQWGFGVARPTPTPQVMNPLEPVLIVEKNRLQYSFVDGQMSVGIVTESNSKISLEAGERDRLSSVTMSSLKSMGIELSAADDSLLLSKGDFSAVSALPISVDLDTKELFLVALGEQLRVNIFPDELVGILSTIDPLFSPAVVGSGIRLETRDGYSVYAVDGSRSYKVFGLWDSSAEGTDYVSADTGELVDQKQSIVGGIVRLFSI